MTDQTENTFPDQLYLNRVREALWRPSKGATVMVGSGFSRNAVPVRPDAESLPLWSDLVEALAKGLENDAGARSERQREKNADRPADPLRLAQEYRVAFGRQRLHQFITEALRDEEYHPGALHFELLRLPWRDVFTTNWDTLLERARKQPDADYRVVMRPDQLAIQDPPRIVKLHGSLPAQFPLVFTEEDYRRYPSEFAAFVNTVQQAMLETVLVLVGFSGDDPNFQRWLGWVRDNLRDSAPKIYLAGWLDLPDHRRRTLEGQNVVPIDLARCPEARQWSRRHEAAIRWFLQELHRGRPYPAEEWPKYIEGHLSEVTSVQEPALQGKSTSSSEVRELLGIWAHNRRLYPGWLALPFASSHGVSDRTDEWEGPILQQLSALRDGVERVSALRELVWRREILLDRLSPDLATAVETVLVEVNCVERRGGERERTDDEWLRAGRAWRELGLAMVTSARQDRHRKNFDRWIRELGDAGRPEPDVEQRLHHERCLWEVQRENYDALDELLGEWDADRKEHDPAWLMRKAGILALVGRAEEARQLLETALERVRSWPKRPGTLSGAARESWLLGHWFSVSQDRSERYQYLTQVVWPRWREFASGRCDPGSEVASYLRSMRPTGGQSVPSFDLAVKPQEVSESVWRARTRIRQAYRAVRLTELAGFGQSFPGGERLVTMAAETLSTREPLLSASLSVRTATYDQDARYKAALSRRRVASMEAAEAEELAGNQLDVIQSALARLRTVEGRRRLFWRERLRVAVETVSRLLPRLPGVKIDEVMSLSLELYADHRIRADVWFGEPLQNLISRSWETLDPAGRSARALGLFAAPIVGVRGFDVRVPLHYPDPVGVLRRPKQLTPSRTAENDAQWCEIVSLLEEGLGSTGEPRKRSALRAVRLSETGRLASAERARLGRALWGPDWGSSQPPQDTGLSSWTVLLFWEPQEGVAEERLRTDWFGSVDWRGQESKSLSKFFDRVGFGLASLEKRARDFPLSEADEQSLRVAVEAWTERPPLSISAEGVSGLARILLRIRLPEELASELARRVVGRSNLVEAERTRRRAEDAGHDFFRQTVLQEELTFIHELVPGLLISCPSRRDRLVECLHTGLASGDFDELLSAARALYLWLEDTRRAGTRLEAPPDTLMREVGLIIASRRRGALANVLEIAQWVFDRGTLKQRDLIQRLVLDGLEHLLRDLAYGVPSHEEEGVEPPSANDDLDVPLLRLRCVQVVVAMAKAGMDEEVIVEKWLGEAEQDPMAEVRLAVDGWRRAAIQNGGGEVGPDTQEQDPN